MTSVLATYNIKGGVGKTSAAVNLAYLAARDGHRTLLWDLDPQGASTFLFRVKPKVKGGGAKLVRGKTDAADRIKGTDHERLDLLPAAVANRLKEVGEATAAIEGITVNLAIGHGGRQEIADAVRSLLSQHAERGTSLAQLAAELDVEHIAEHLYTSGQPDPDFVIRTSGEQRLSGFLLWQSAYAEMVYQDVLWPDFDRRNLWDACVEYASRDRRFGGAIPNEVPPQQPHQS